MKRYYVEPEDTCGTVENAVRDRQWNVIDRVTGRCVSNHDRRTDARKAAAEMNAAPTLASAPAPTLASDLRDAMNAWDTIRATARVQHPNASEAEIDVLTRGAFDHALNLK